MLVDSAPSSGLCGHQAHMQEIEWSSCKNRIPMWLQPALRNHYLSVTKRNILLRQPVFWDSLCCLNKQFQKGGLTEPQVAPYSCISFLIPTLPAPSMKGPKQLSPSADPSVPVGEPRPLLCVLRNSLICRDSGLFPAFSTFIPGSEI